MTLQKINIQVEKTVLEVSIILINNTLLASLKKDSKNKFLVTIFTYF